MFPKASSPNNFSSAIHRKQYFFPIRTCYCVRKSIQLFKIGYTLLLTPPCDRLFLFLFQWQHSSKTAQIQKWLAWCSPLDPEQKTHFRCNKIHISSSSISEYMYTATLKIQLISDDLTGLKHLRFFILCHEGMPSADVNAMPVCDYAPAFICPWIRWCNDTGTRNCPPS